MIQRAANQSSGQRIAEGARPISGSRVGSIQSSIPKSVGYRLVNMLARDGEQTGVTVNALRKSALDLIAAFDSLGRDDLASNVTWRSW